MKRKCKPNPNQPNILWICTDQQRYDTIGALGNPSVETPHLDRLCEEGVACTRAYCQSPVCTPSRASMMTGRYPSSIHVNSLGNEAFPEDVSLYTQILADSGYLCGLSGKLHLASAITGGEKRARDGFSDFHYSHDPWQGCETDSNEYALWLKSQGVAPEEAYICTLKADHSRRSYYGMAPTLPPCLRQTRWCADRAIDWIRREHTAPWLYLVNIFDPHPPFDAPEHLTEKYQKKGLEPPLFSDNDPQTQERLQSFYFQSGFHPPDKQTMRHKASYYAMVEMIDQEVGRLLQGLEETGQRENTLILFTSDHGEMLGDHGLIKKGCRFYEGLVRVPLIFSWPGHFKQNGRHDGLVELTDIVATLADINGVTLAHPHGVSLLPILTGAAVPPENRRAFARCEYYRAQSPEYVAGATSPSYATMHVTQRYKLVTYHGIHYGELYDLRDDPHELTNLWEHPQYASLRHDLLCDSYAATVAAQDTFPTLIGPF